MKSTPNFSFAWGPRGGGGARVLPPVWEQRNAALGGTALEGRKERVRVVVKRTFYMREVRVLASSDS